MPKSRAKKPTGTTKQDPPQAPPVPVVGVDGNEILMLDAMLPVLHPKARAGDSVAIDQVVKILDLRMKYVRHRRAMEDS